MNDADQRAVRILVIGSEVTQGFVRDSNTQFISSELFSLGIEIREVRTIPDNLETIVTSLRDLISTGDFVITTGGLGPTDDDLTVDALCAVFKTQTVLVERCVNRLKKLVINRNGADASSSESLNNRLIRQCRIPTNAEALKNKAGLAPGIFIQNPGVMSMPGFPMEIQSIWPGALEKISLELKGTYLSKRINVWGISESLIYETLKHPPEVKIGNHALPWGNQIFIRAPHEYEKEFAQVVASLENRFPENIIQNPLEAWVDFLGKKNLTFGTVESCTGGFAAKLLTDIPGVSSIYPGSIISYDNRVKTSLLSVHEQTLEKFGAVSRETALEMVRGGASTLASDITISITGIAGPTGGTPEKPEGTVFFGIYDRRDQSAYTGTAYFPVGRERFRNFTVYFIYLALYQRYIYFANENSWLASSGAKSFRKES